MGRDEIFWIRVIDNKIDSRLSRGNDHYRVANLWAERVYALDCSVKIG